MASVAEIFGLMAAATVFGSMAFFSFVVAPLIFVKLDASNAALFVRGIFPWYYAVIAILSLIAAVALAVLRPAEAVLLAAVGVGSVVSRQLLMPRINHHRDRMQLGDSEAAQVFNRLHKLSVWINGGQLAMAFAVLLLLAIR